MSSISPTPQGEVGQSHLSRLGPAQQNDNALHRLGLAQEDVGGGAAGHDANADTRFTSIMLLALHKHHNSIVHTEYGYGPTCSLQRVTHRPCSLQGLNPAIGSPRSEVHWAL